MKTRGLFLSALMMGAVLAGCSNEEVPQNVEPREVQKSDSYIAVNIVAPSAASRATTDGGFVAGTEAENTVNKALFVFFNENGGFVEAVGATGDELKPWTAGEGTVDQISTAVIVLNNPETYPKSVVALLNTEFTETSIGTPSLEDLKGMIGDYSKGFVMSNSVYLDGEKDMTATPLTDANIQNDADLAKQNPVTITVERVVAKVSALQNAESFTVTGKDVKLDGEDVTLVPEITGYKVVATNPDSYLVKNIDGINITDWTWNDAANLRSYWANSAAPEAYTYYSYNDIRPVADYAEYCQENTSDNPTLLLVSATIKPEGAETAENILKYKGLYYTTKGLLTKANQMLADYTYPVTTEAGSGTSNDWAPYLTIVDAGEDAEPWEVKVALTEGAPEVAGVADVINGMDTAAQWTEGKAYFYVAIEGLGGEAGIVRNHYHLLTIDAISGMGTPVYNPEEIIIPQPMPEEEYFVAAKVQILKWKQVNQSVTLE